MLRIANVAVIEDLTGYGIDFEHIVFLSGLKFGSTVHSNAAMLYRLS
jgi:hypothetical protein